jgi:hypothetical protein
MKDLLYLGSHLKLKFRLLLKVQLAYPPRNIKQEVGLLLITLLIIMLLLQATLRNEKLKVSIKNHPSFSILQISCKTLRAIKAAKSASSMLRR